MPAILFGLVAAVALGVWAQEKLAHPALAPHVILDATDVPGPKVRATYFGTSTILLEGEQGAVMVDGFFSRPSKLKLVSMWPLAPDEGRIRAALAAANVDNLDAVLVSHSHHDHAMDSAAVARMKGASLVGSTSSRNLALGEGFTGPFHVPNFGTELSIVSARDPSQPTGFSVEAFPSKHSPKPVFPGTIDDKLGMAERPLSAFKEGGTYSFVIRHATGTVLVQPSANYLCGKLKKVKADVVFLSIGLLGKQSDTFARNYWREVVLATGAKLVIPVHWDDFTVPLAEPLSVTPLAMDDVARGIYMVVALGKEFQVPVAVMPALQPLDLLPARRPASDAEAEAKRRVALAEPCEESPPAG
ncbi:MULTISPECIES: MBL fold metallo-hydrolase [unclassified Variovorax]|uniref:MBL fold metallo-hydrolase n=1 Tax=unclassified Variovorax TaxID=663243 RepID=UPI000838D0B6|nr:MULTISPECIES: MBL fold metallo-hydrolase [unclassified Variovorax]PNG50309.1 hypothetical protein CHC06_05932 [Variovorax sp. B2]PNG51182.1 hypothetical protein CHC07_05838 [Variovorax sp. B4]VTV17398.1 hypothetical protein WDL1P1_00359 [Variovorax sp. WDL1]